MRRVCGQFVAQIWHNMWTNRQGFPHELSATTQLWENNLFMPFSCAGYSQVLVLLWKHFTRVGGELCPLSPALITMNTKEN